MQFSCTTCTVLTGHPTCRTGGGRPPPGGGWRGARSRGIARSRAWAAGACCGSRTRHPSRGSDDPLGAGGRRCVLARGRQISSSGSGCTLGQAGVALPSGIWRSPGSEGGSARSRGIPGPEPGRQGRAAAGGISAPDGDLAIPFGSLTQAPLQRSCRAEAAAVFPSPYYLTPQHVCANIFLAKNRPGGAGGAPPIERQKTVRRQLKEQDNQPSRDPAHRPTRPLGQVSTQAVLTFRQLTPSFLRARQGIPLCIIPRTLF